MNLEITLLEKFQKSLHPLGSFCLSMLVIYENLRVGSMSTSSCIFTSSRSTSVNPCSWFPDYFHLLTPCSLKLLWRSEDLCFWGMGSQSWDGGQKDLISNIPHIIQPVRPIPGPCREALILLRFRGYLPQLAGMDGSSAFL